MKCFYCDTEIVTPISPDACGECRDIVRLATPEHTGVIRDAAENARSSGLKGNDVRVRMNKALVASEKRRK
jgi:hypothetical protein